MSTVDPRKILPKSRATASQFFDVAPSSSTTDRPSCSTVDRSSSTPKVKHFSCQVCNMRTAYTPAEYTRHMQSTNHRMAELLHQHNVWPGKGSRPFILLGGEDKIDFESPELRRLMLTEGKPLWFVRKNEPRVVCLLCFEMVADCTFAVRHQNNTRHVKRLVGAEWRTTEHCPRHIQFCVPCQIYVPHANMREHNRTALHLESNLKFRIAHYLPLTADNVHTAVMGEREEELKRRLNERAKRRLRIENQVVGELDTSEESGEDMELEDEPLPSAKEATKEEEVAIVDHSAVDARLKKLDEPPPHRVTVVENKRLNNPVQLLNNLLSSSTGQSAMSTLLCTLPAPAEATTKDTARRTVSVDFAVIPPNDTYPAHVWHGLPDLNPNSINWLRSTMPSTSREAYYRKMETEECAKHGRRIEERLLARQSITPTAISKYEGRLHIVASLAGALPILLDALPKATRDELALLCRELSPVSVKLATENEEGAHLLREMCMHLNLNTEDKTRFVDRFVRDLSTEDLLAVLLNEHAVHLLDVVYRLGIGDANDVLAHKLVATLAHRPEGAFDAAKHPKTVRFFEHFIRSRALSRSIDVVAQFSAVLDLPFVMPSMLRSPICRSFIYSMTGCLATTPQRLQLADQFIKAMVVDDVIVEMARCDHKTLIRVFDMADEGTRTTLVRTALIAKHAVPSIYAVLLRDTNGCFVARRMFEKGDGECKKVIIRLVHEQMDTLLKCDNASTVARIVRRYAANM